MSNNLRKMSQLQPTQIFQFKNQNKTSNLLSLKFRFNRDSFESSHREDYNQL